MHFGTVRPCTLIHLKTPCATLIRLVGCFSNIVTRTGVHNLFYDLHPERTYNITSPRPYIYKNVISHMEMKKAV